MERTIPTEQYYTCSKHLELYYDEKGRKDKLVATTKEEYLEWKKSTKSRLIELIGLKNMTSCDLKPELIEKITVDNGIIREKIIIQVEPNVFMPLYILIPEKINKGEVQCILCPHGHSGAGKYSVAGRYDIPSVADKIDVFNYDYGMQLAKLGFVTLCPDSRGFGERREEQLQNDSEDSFLNSTCFQLAHMAEPLGQTVIGMCTWDLMRLLDYISERNEWNSKKVGCVGFSGGGMQNLFLAALDERIDVSIISGYMYGYKDSLLKLSGNCSCNYVPHLWEHVDMGDIGSLIAPRSLMIQTGTKDHLNGERGVINAIEQVDVIRTAFDLLDSSTNLYHEIFEGPHKFSSNLLEEFLKPHINSNVHN